jgi:mannose-6-phosphate isomerase-like protein (cupin superfamily)
MNKQIFIGSVTNLAKENTLYRSIIYTTHHSQLVLMSIDAGSGIEEEIHEESDQIFRIEEGKGVLVIGGTDHHAFSEGDTFVVPAGTKHQVKNSGDQVLKLSTLYVPPHHKAKIDV